MPGTPPKSTPAAATPAPYRLTGWEASFQERMRGASPHARRALVVMVLGVAALLMVLAWIYHLKHPNYSFGIAYLVSLAFVCVEFFLNTWITRYSQSAGVLSSGYLALVSVLWGLVLLAILALTMFKEQNKIQNKWATGVGFVLVIIGAVLLLYDTHMG